MSQVDDLIERIQLLEEEVQTEFDKRRGDFLFTLDEKRLLFSSEVLAVQRGSRRSVVRFVAGAAPLMWLTAPIIYAGVVPFLLLDLFLFLFQTICFPVYHIPKAKRSDFVVLDRGDLEYLNAVERLNCLYCGYANGIAGYFREIAARTEQHWCPIKHARRIADAHDRYPSFFEYGDAESYRLGLERLRASMDPSRDAS